MGVTYPTNCSSILIDHLMHWDPLRDCEDAVGLFPRIESFGSGSLLELVSLHNIDYDAIGSGCTSRHATRQAV